MDFEMPKPGPEHETLARGGISTGQVQGNQLTFENTSPMGHHRYRYTFLDGEYRFEMAMSPDGAEWQTMMEGTYRPA